MSQGNKTQQNRELRELARSTFKGLEASNPVDLEPVDLFRKRMLKQPQPRRAGLRPPTDSIGMLSLVRRPNGVLEWAPGLQLDAAPARAQRAGRAALPAGQIIEQFRYSKIAPNQVQSVLDALDRKLTPYGLVSESPSQDLRLREWNGTTLVAFDGAKAGGKKVLLLVNGTFSNCDHLLSEIQAAPNKKGDEFLAKARSCYDHVLSFDNATLGVSPVMNAFDLAALLRPAPASLDIICHSRGGLVVRWFLEGFADPQMKSRAMLVGSTISGTSLAAPERQKAVFQYLTNLGATLGELLKLGSAHPIFLAAGTLMTVLSSATGLVAKTPILDASMMLIPGLQGQSRVGNNAELRRLRSNTGGQGMDYYAITSDFQPKDPGWNFLQYFSKPMLRVANAGADLLFDGPNDLVVDTNYMTELSDTLSIPDTKVFRYGKNETVYHTNYFRQTETLRFIREKFGIS